MSMEGVHKNKHALAFNESQILGKKKRCENKFQLANCFNKLFVL
jgi:hypothetical protein